MGTIVTFYQVELLHKLGLYGLIYPPIANFL